MYTVVVCPDSTCRGVSIVDGRPDTCECRRCRSARVLDSYRIAYTADTTNEARHARTKLVAKISSSGPSYEELLDSGALSFDTDEPDVEITDTRTPEEKLRDAVKEATPQTESEIVACAVTEGMTQAKAEKLFERMRRAGEVIRSGDEFELL